ncbi:MAG: carbon-nitrogen hydrolase family protein [Candidatus Bruticola sp.]
MVPSSGLCFYVPVCFNKLMNKIRLLQAQIKTVYSLNEIRAVLERICRSAASAKAQMITLPEMFCCPYETALFSRYAEEEGGPICNICAEMANTYKLYLSAGSMPEKDYNGHIFNTAYVFNASGEIIAKHRKMHLFDINIRDGQHFQESETLSAGNHATIFDTEFGRFGLCICYDFRFPELGRLMALQGASIVLVPAAFNMTTGPAHWELIFRSQAMFNQFFALGTAPARCQKATYQSWGHTIAVDPWGEVIKQMGQEEGMQIIEIDLNLVKEVREQLPLLKHRRTDLYQLTWTAK